MRDEIDELDSRRRSSIFVLIRDRLMTISNQPRGSMLPDIILDRLAVVDTRQTTFDLINLIARYCLSVSISITYSLNKSIKYVYTVESGYKNIFGE